MVSFDPIEFQLIKIIFHSNPRQVAKLVVTVVLPH